MDIAKIVNNMQEFQREMHNEFKDAETFWKHFYIKLDKEIYEAFLEMMKGEKTEESPYKEKVIHLIKEVFKSIDCTDIEVIEVGIK